MAKKDFEGELRKLAFIKREFRPMLWRLSCIQGVGIGFKYRGGEQTDQPAVIFYVTKKVEARHLATSGIIPSRIEFPDPTNDGKPYEIVTDVIESGYFSKQAVYTARHRPAHGGDSIGHLSVTAGTLGCLVKDATDGEAVILSNNHVLANSNAAAIGDPIVQPGPYDGGTDPHDRLARLKRFVPIDFNGECNHVDGAIASPLDDRGVVDPDIHDIGIPNGSYYVGARDIGMKVQKTGRTTGHTTGKIISINTDVSVNYGSSLKKKMARFCDQIVTTDMSEGGDSGSVGCTAKNQVFGLLFAGSSTQTIYNPIQFVERELRITIP